MGRAGGDDGGHSDGSHSSDRSSGSFRISESSSDNLVDNSSDNLINNSSDNSSYLFSSRRRRSSHISPPVY